MDPKRIAELLSPFVTKEVSPEPKDLSFRTGSSPEESAVLSPRQLDFIATYIDILLRWNARINLTAVRQSEEIVTRHFGESIFAARCLFPHPPTAAQHLIDLGSGAGFPGLPIKILLPELTLTLIEANQKKATFLREVVRATALENVTVFSGRGESYTGERGDIVTLRAVEQFEKALPIATGLVAPHGRLALLIGNAQASKPKLLCPDFSWSDGIPVPRSNHRIVLIGSRT